MYQGLKIELQDNFESFLGWAGVALDLIGPPISLKVEEPGYPTVNEFGRQGPFSLTVGGPASPPLTNSAGSAYFR